MVSTMTDNLGYIQMVISGRGVGEIGNVVMFRCSPSSRSPVKCRQVHEQLSGLEQTPDGLRVTIIHSGSNHKLECLPCRHHFAFKAVSTKEGLEGLRVWLRSFESGLKLHKSQIF